MDYPPLLQGASPAQYRSFFETNYCNSPIRTFDGIEVRFRKNDFNHCFFESKNFKDDTFSQLRAERLLWIKAALQDPESDLFIGWNSKKKIYEANRRVIQVKENYVVVIALKGIQKADFITAYIADNEKSLKKIRSGPRWV